MGMQEGWEKPLWLSKILGQNKTEILEKLDSIENIFKTAGDATATDSDIVKPKTAYNGNVLLTGTLEDKTGTENHAATASVDATNSRLKMQVPATAKYGVGNYLYATYSTIASLIGLTASKLLAGNTILGIAGGIANRAGTTVQASAVTQDDTNTYFNVPAAGYYDTNSKVYTPNSNLGCDLVKASLYATGASAKYLELIFFTDRKYNSVSFNCVNLNSGNGISIFGSNDNANYTNIVQFDSINGDRTFTGLSSYKYIKIQNRYDNPSAFSTDINNIKWS